MFISEVLLGTAGIDVSSDENFGLILERNVNASNEFTTSETVNLETHKIMQVGTSSSKSSSAIIHEMVQLRRGINPALAKNTVECMTQRGFRISCPHPLPTKRI